MVSPKERVRWRKTEFNKKIDMKSIILAGGSGTRLWPLSREYFPKQFIKFEQLSLFQQCCKRAIALSGIDNIIIVTSTKHQYLVRDQIEELGHTIPENNILGEPIGKNTLPAITWAMQQIRKSTPDSSVAVFPSDHLLGNEAIQQIRNAESLTGRYLVTFGVRPISPHTGYGYIQPGRPVPPGFVVTTFKEKPDEKTAREYVEKGYLWNSGIFLFSVSSFFKELKRHNKALGAAFEGEEIPEYESLESISIDYGLLEHSKNVAVVPLNAKWSDLGTFKAIYDAGEQDSHSNVGTADYIEAEGNYVYAPNRHVGLIGVKDLTVVDTDDALLVCDNRRTEDVKKLVSLYNQRRDPITKFHRQVHRPWGSYTILEESEFYKIKRVTVRPKKKLSLQLHHHRSEHWVVVSGTAEVQLGTETRLLRQGQSTFVEGGIKHRLKNPGRIPLEVIEVQLGEYLEEDDIVRFEDDYGRE